MTFKETKRPVLNRGSAPDSFLTQLIDWAKAAPDDIFAPNETPVDIFTVIKSSLGRLVSNTDGGKIYAWDNLTHRRAAMCEAMRVHAGFESSWNWNEGVDQSNATSMANKTGQESGVFQVSFDSEWINDDAMKGFAQAHDIETPDKFIVAMKQSHKLALEYYARLARISIKWAGPLLRHGSNSVYPWLSRESCEEFQALLA